MAHFTSHGLRRKGRKPRIALYAAIGLLFAMLPALSSSTASAATSVTLTLRINNVLQIENPDTAAGDGDYFPEVRIGDGPLERRGVIEDDVFSPGWQFTQTVNLPAGQSSVPILIRLWDEDSGPTEGGDDKMDISPQDDDVDLDLVYYDTVEGNSWSGDLLNSLTVGQGDGDHGFPSNNDGRKARIDFSISNGTSVDIDGDGIPDAVEQQDAVYGPDGFKVADLVGLDPCRKSVVVQIDYMSDSGPTGHSHEPDPNAIGEVKAAFDAAPVDAVSPCPYPGDHKATGMDFIHVRGKAIGEQPVMNFEDEDLGDDYRSARNANFNFSLAIYAHYAIFAHDLRAGKDDSGQCCEPERGHNKDFLVTLGSWTGGVGTTREQSGSIMHELGHALGLDHGGSDDTNYKPNYLSVMNYSFDPDGIPTGPGSAPDRLDYSRASLPTLKKTALLEPNGIGDGTDMTSWTAPDRSPQFGRGNAALNWNNNVDPTTMLPVIDPNPVDVNINAGDDASTQRTELTGHDDWHSLKFRAAAAQTANGAGVSHGPDIGFDTAQKRRTAFHDFYDPDVTVTKTVDKTDAKSGDTLGYTVQVKNVGKGTATAVGLTDTFPDATTATRSLPNLGPSATATASFTYLVPCATEDGTKLTNKATATATNLDGGPEANTTNNTGTATTTVHAPRLTLTKKASPTVNAGEAITSTITYANTGSDGASEVTVTDTLPAGVYYSPALDLGTGPKPNSVTLNADGTRTLVWNVGDVPATSGDRTIVFTARPTLLSLPGATHINKVSVSYKSAGGACTFAPVTASAQTSITAVTPSRLPLLSTLWGLRTDLRTAEVLARVQATDTRFDGADNSAANGTLSQQEASAVLFLPVTQPRTVRAELLATMFNLASRRINAGTAVNTLTIRGLGLNTVGDAVRYAQATLAQPPTLSNLIRYTNTTLVLTEINSGVAERY
ncbi:conserved repeat domain-containing protein [Streptosporangium subroseum]|uniref:Conserved repeat domain-containing protein n=1 Tax=Streptosporangium subroseum TaxID=106412 RepID=A0A239EFQ0_9ACTN|nr:conserved repeat domain-containing protein [Streptosporangium subroseum]